MSFKIKDMQEILADMIKAGAVTEESDLIMATDDPAQGGQVYLIIASGFAQRTMTDTPEETTVFFEIKTPMEVQLLIAKEAGSIVEDSVVQ